MADLMPEAFPQPVRAPDMMSFACREPASPDKATILFRASWFEESGLVIFATLATCLEQAQELTRHFIKEDFSILHRIKSPSVFVVYEKLTRHPIGPDGLPEHN